MRFGVEIVMRKSALKAAQPPKPKPPPPRPPRPPPPPPGLRFGAKDQHRDDYVYGDGSIRYVVLPQGSDGKSSNDAGNKKAAPAVGAGTLREISRGLAKPATSLGAKSPAHQSLLSQYQYGLLSPQT